ncbi:carbohydrate ABC transporter permease [Archangium sp.]|uniref:carbohydrate ABC transporter permease n=1 Tax=Archangium sp. TaxID=1872627 RepID=UPI002D69BA4A|nr:carbohydrate ABC transporter permease [Archangium sp.]HYO56954.1 carbohydrate ABC transporter permease [Archangium sp.]
MRQRLAISSFIAYAIVGAGAVLMLAPFYFMFVFATHTRTEIFQVPPPFWFGGKFMSNMSLLLQNLPFWTNLGLSLYVAVMSTALTLLVCSMGGYAFAIYRFRFQKALFALVMGAMLLPPFVSMIPNFLLMDLLGWLNQPRALYLPAVASSTGALGVFMMRQYIGTAIPKEMIEAARIDGCGELRIYWSIVLPLLGPALGTLGLIAFISSWNNFIQPLVVMHSPERYTVPLALRSLQSPTNTEWGVVMAGSAVSVLPLLVMFAFSARRLIAGLTAGAVRG